MTQQGLALASSPQAARVVQNPPSEKHSRCLSGKSRSRGSREGLSSAAAFLGGHGYATVEHAEHRRPPTLPSGQRVVRNSWLGGQRGASVAQQPGAQRERARSSPQPRQAAGGRRRACQPRLCRAVPREVGPGSRFQTPSPHSLFIRFCSAPGSQDS